MVFSSFYDAEKLTALSEAHSTRWPGAIRRS